MRLPGYTVDAMVGQVNGRAIYADQVLEPMEDQLAAMGRQLRPGEFRRQAYQQILRYLRSMIADALLYGEARRGLTEIEHGGLKRVIQQHREELLRIYGQGSLALAEQNIKLQLESTLDQQVEKYRQTVVVQKLLHEKLIPRINVTKGDIIRYYREHNEQFNPPVIREIHVIRAPDSEVAQQVRGYLTEGQSFKSIAGSELNTWKRSEAGAMTAIGQKVFRQAPLNKRMLGLAQGQYTDEPIQIDDAYWFLFMASIDRPASRSIAEVQLEIKQILHQQQFRMLADEYRSRLFETGSFNTLEEMAEALTAIAANRYSDAPIRAAAN